MAITHIATILSSTSPFGGSPSSAIDTTGATLLVVTVSWYSAATTALTVTDSKGNTWTPLTLRNTGTSAQRVWYAATPIVGASHTVTIASGGAGIYANVTLSAFAGVHATPFEVENGATATAGTSLATGSVTPAANGALIVSGWTGMNATSNPTVSGVTLTASQNPVGGVRLAGAFGYTIQTTAAAINPTWSWTGSDHVAESVAVFKASPLPTTGLTGHYDASNADDLFKTFVSGGPHTGTPIDGESVAVWDHEAGANRIFKQSGAIALPVWRQTTPLMPLPCLDFTGGQKLILTNNTNTNQPLSSLIAADAFTMLIAFYAESATGVTISYNLGNPLIGESGGYWAVVLTEQPGGFPPRKISAYNYDGTQDYVTIDVTTGASHVVMVRHQSGNLYISLDGGAESSVASGNTAAAGLANAVSIGQTYQSYDGRIGEIAIYNTALTGTDLTDAIDYFTTKWLPAAAPTEGRVSQLALETLSLPTPSARVSQAVVEVLGSSVAPVAPGRVTPFVVEILSENPAVPAGASERVELFIWGPL